MRHNAGHSNADHTLHTTPIRQPKLNLCSIFLKYKKYNHAKKIVKIYQSLVENQQCKYIWALKDRITIFSKSETIYD